jgi:hypothetical protein
MTTKALSNMVVVVNVRLAISMSDSGAALVRGPQFFVRHRPNTIKSIRTTTISPNPVIGFSLNSLLFGQRGRLPSSATMKRKAKTTISMANALSI